MQALSASYYLVRTSKRCTLRVYCDCYFTYLPFLLLTRNKGVACSFETKWGAEIVLSLLRKAPLSWNYCKLYCYKWCWIPQDIPSQWLKYQSVPLAFSERAIESRALRTRSWSLENQWTLKRELKWLEGTSYSHLKHQKLIMNRAFTQGTGGGPVKRILLTQLNV